jgi:hypothetical protein
MASIQTRPNVPDLGGDLGRSRSQEPAFNVHFFEYNRDRRAAATTNSEPRNSPRLIVLGGMDLVTQELSEKLCRLVDQEWGLGSIKIMSAFYESDLLNEKHTASTLEDFYQNGANSQLAKAARRTARATIEAQLLPQDYRIPQDVSNPQIRKTYVDDLAKKFSTDMFFGFSLGSIALNAFDRELATALVERGFTPTEADELREYLVILTIGDVGVAGARSDELRHGWKIPACNFASIGDIRVFRTLSRDQRIAEEAARGELRVFELDSSNRILVTVPLKSEWYYVDSKERESTKDLAEYTDETGHQPRVYLTPKVWKESEQSASYGVFIPRLIKFFAKAILDPATPRPCNLPQLFASMQEDEFVAYYAHYIELVLTQLGASNSR